MPDAWRLLLQPIPDWGAWNMAVDEAILEEIIIGRSPPTVRFYAWKPACLSLGYSQSIRDVDQNNLDAFGWNLVRRSTGGRAVLHIDELTYSINGPGDNAILSGTLMESYQRIASALVAGLQQIGLPADVKEYRSLEKKEIDPVCFQIPSMYEITANGRKLIGSAQVRKRGGVLQHGTLPLTGDLGRIVQVLVYPNDATKVKTRAALMQHATTLETALGRQVTWEQAASVFATSFESVLPMDLLAGDLTLQEVNKAKALEIEKYSNPNWTNRH